MSRLELFDVIDKFLKSHAPRVNTKKKKGVGVGQIVIWNLEKPKRFSTHFFMRRGQGAKGIAR